MTVPIPAHVAPYVEALGVEGAERCFLTFGGSEVWMESGGARSELAQEFGVEKARALADRLCVTKVRIPTAKPWLAQVMKARGLTVGQIARTLHTSDFTVRNYLSGRKTDKAKFRKYDPRQMTFL